MKRCALVIIGSRSDEREQGLDAGPRVAQALRRRGWEVEEIDGGMPHHVVARLMTTDPGTIVVPIAYGVGGGEDGLFHSVASLLGIPCAGPNGTTGGLSMDKYLFQLAVDGLFKDDPSVRTPKTCVFTESSPLDQSRQRVAALGSPLIVKPNFSGASLGVSIATTPEEALDLVRALLPSAHKVLCQELVTPADELSVTVLDRSHGPEVLPIVWIQRSGMVYGYDDKNQPDANQRHIIPAPIDQRRADDIIAACRRLHDAIGACGLFRYDVLVTTREIVFLEVNSIPGLMQTSIAPDAAKAAGITYDSLIEDFALSSLLGSRSEKVSTEECER